MPWTQIPTTAADFDCRPPFSFYFDLVGRFWKTSTNTNNHPLHRICTLSRKQGATHVCLEDRLSDTSIIEEIDMLDAALGGAGAAEAMSFTFLISSTSTLDINGVVDSDVLGHIVLINYRQAGSATFTHSYICEGILSIPMLPHDGTTRRVLLNNFICRERAFDVTVKGRTFRPRGVYFCQQNTVAHVCAHAALRMGINTMNEVDPLITSKTINDKLQIAPPFTSGRGLQIQQVTDIITDAGYANNTYPCSALSPTQNIATLSSIVESGYVALLVFTTGGTTEHVVTVFGHTRNSDEWHPQALPAYAGPASTPYYSSSAWTDHFVINDDNFGPYFSLTSRALEVDRNVRADWIIALCPVKLEVSPVTAEALAAFFSIHVFGFLNGKISGNWLTYMTTMRWTYIFRPILMTKDRYIEHLKDATGHDLSRIAQTELTYFNHLPDNTSFWMVEISLPGIYTGNRSKLGEVLLKADTSFNQLNAMDVFLGMRLPGKLVMGQPTGTITLTDLSLDTHVPMYRTKDHDHQW